MSGYCAGKVNVFTCLPKRKDLSFETIILHGETVNIKVGPYGAKPEHKDLQRIAEKTNIPLRQLSVQANLAFNKEQEQN